MIRVTIELLSAITGRTSLLGRMFIANDGKASAENPELGDYLVAVCRRGADPNFVPWPVDPNGHKGTRAGEVKGYPRLAYNVWRLITRACLSAFPEEVKALPKNRATPVLDEAAMRGLQLLREHFDDDGHNWMDKPTCFEDIDAARAWLDENKLDEGAGNLGEHRP